MDQYRAKPLFKLQNFWRVDGTSDVEWVNGSLKIGYVLSRLRDDYSDPLTATAREDLPPKVLVLSPSWINFLTVGSVWNGGKRVSKPARLGRSLEIDTSQAVNQAANLRDKWNTKDITAADLSSPKDQKSPSVTLYTIVPIIGDKQFKWMVIPNSEIFRYYFAVSRRIAKKVLNGETSSLIDFSKSVGNDPITIFELVRLKDIEATFLGRIQANKSFKEEVFQINKRITAINTTNSNGGSNSALALEANFPFSGRTRLSVAGTPMQLANEPAIYAMEIHHCTYPLGFSSLIIESSGSQTAGGKLAEKGKGHRSFNVPSHDPDDEDEQLDDSPADARLRRREIPLTSAGFPQDTDIKIEYRRSLEHKDKIATYVSEEIDIGGLTLGDGNFRAASKNTLGADDFREEAPQAARELNEFFEMLQGFGEIAKEKQWSVDSRAINGAIPINSNNSKINACVITSLPMLGSKKRTWHLITTKDGVRTRQLACIEVTTTRTQRFFYILEIELKDNEPGQCTFLIRRRDFKKISDDDFNILLKLTCYKNRWPDFDSDSWEKSKQRALAENFKKDHISKKLHHPKNREFWCANLTSSVFKWLKIPQPDKNS